MIQFEEKVLSNGLHVIVHQDDSSQLVAVNTLYKVGSRNEDPEKTGFAHLFEHLMFAGSQNAPDFDEPIQKAGGENNAFTNSDLTNFYEILPSENLETALWLESDRMQYLDCSEKNFKIQQNVVLEEFKETTLNQPYGDVWHHLSALSYQRHPYQWPTIGKTPEHIARADINEVKKFYQRFYNPNNAIVCVSGNIEINKAFELVEKWFGEIQQGREISSSWPFEKAQNDFRSENIYSNVPLPAIYFSFPMVDRLHKDYYTYDIISDVLSGGRSSRFFQNLIKDTNLFSQVDAYITGTMDPGLFIAEAKPLQGVDMELIYEKLWKELKKLKQEPVSEYELQKVKNKIENALAFSEVNILNKAINLSYFASIGNTDLINEQAKSYQSVQAEDILRISQDLFTKEKCSQLNYLPEHFRVSV